MQILAILSLMDEYFMVKKKDPIDRKLIIRKSIYAKLPFENLFTSHIFFGRFNVVISIES